MNNRERFLSVLNFKKPDGFPVMEFFGFWAETRTRWLKEGLDEKEDLFEYFGLITPKYIPIDYNFVPPFEEKILEEYERHLLIIDANGCTKKIEKNSSAMPHFIDFPIKGRKDFEGIKERMDPFDYQRRYPSNWEQLVKEYKNRDYPLGLTIRGPFAFCRDFINFEQLMLMVYDDFELVKEMMEFQVDFTIDLWKKAVQEVDVDFVMLGEDMAYKNGTMFSPQLLDQLVKPLYRKLADFFTASGIDHFIIDSDGDVSEIIPMYIDGGITGMLPVENCPGMDPVEIRKKFPKFQMIGGINKLKVAEGGAELDGEIAKASALVKTGGYIPSFDHSVPPILSFKEYGAYLQKMKLAVNESIGSI